MHPFIEVECPYCGAECVLPVDTADGESELVSDCENCCRPFHLRIRMDQGEISDWSIDI